MNLGFWEWVAIAVVVMLLFGTKRLRTAGEDLGSAIRGFKKSMGEETNPEHDATHIAQMDEAKKSEKAVSNCKDTTDHNV